MVQKQQRYSVWLSLKAIDTDRPKVGWGSKLTTIFPYHYLSCGEVLVP